MPPVSRSSDGVDSYRMKKKQGLIDKLLGFFEKYFGFNLMCVCMFSTILV
ncbi:MAG: hypothetical protein LBJ36_06650 [Synergistaceae bacterium]|nr:hypothetical protein [Synergistaceae bacterium]